MVILVGVVDATTRLVGGAEGAASILSPDNIPKMELYISIAIPATAVVSMVIAGGLSPAVFLAMMEIL